ncbi:hypothetical protein [[Eubacterium] cellulosolvens]
MKQYTCVQVVHHKDVGNTIDEWLQKGWRLHTYACSTGGGGGLTIVNHYLLFERGE